MTESNNKTDEGDALQVAICAIVAKACEQAQIKEKFHKEIQTLLHNEALFTCAIRTNQDYDCMMHSGVQMRLLHQLSNCSRLDLGKGGGWMDLESEAYRWINDTAKEIADELEKQLQIIDLTPVVLYPTATSKVKLIVDFDDSIAEVLYYPKGVPETEKYPEEQTLQFPESL